MLRVPVRNRGHVRTRTEWGDQVTVTYSHVHTHRVGQAAVLRTSSLPHPSHVRLSGVGENF